MAGIDAMEAEGLPAHARELGAGAMERLQALAGTLPQLRVRGLGLMIGVEIVDGRTPTARGDVASAIQQAALREGVLLITSGLEGNVIRILPPLVITDGAIAHGLDVLAAPPRHALWGAVTA